MTWLSLLCKFVSEHRRYFYNPGKLPNKFVQTTVVYVSDENLHDKTFEFGIPLTNLNPGAKPENLNVLILGLK